MFPKLHVTVTSGRDVEIALDLVQVQTAPDTATVRGGTPEAGGLTPAGLLLAEGDNVVYVLLAEAFLVVPPRSRDGLPVAVHAELVDAFAIDPLVPSGGVLLEAGGGENAVAGGVLDVDVQVLALHLEDNVEVDLQAVADTLFHGEGVVLGAAPPPAQLGPQQQQ